MKKIPFLFLVLFLFSCASKTAFKQQEDLICIQIVDRNGIDETISSKERLAKYKNTNFLDSQPYQQVIQIFDLKKSEKKTSKITTYHDNGLIWQYLEIVNSRAFGMYREWHKNGQLAIEATVIGGPADTALSSQKDWIFDEVCKAWDENGNLLSIFNYEKGLLEGNSQYFHPNGKIEKIENYSKNELTGEVIHYNETGEIILKSNYLKGKKHGRSEGFFEKNKTAFFEEYENDLLITAKYFDKDGYIFTDIFEGTGIKAIFTAKKLDKLTEYKNGVVEGKVQIFKKDHLHKVYHIKNGKKEGEEIEYYPVTTIYNKDKNKQKLSVNWLNDTIQGMVKTWYENSSQQSQKEYYQNKKNGISSSWYKDGSLMFVEEYENDILLKGSYYKKGENIPASTIINGNGTVTLFDENGNFLQKIKYTKGVAEE